MATILDNKMIGCVFQWKIENIRHCCLQKIDSYRSPAFTANTLQDTKWTLMFYTTRYINNNLEFYLRREEDCTGPKIICVNYRLAFLGKDGSILRELETSESKCIKKNQTVSTIDKFLTLEKVFLIQKGAFFYEDTLTVQCTLWEYGKFPVEPLHLYAKTVLKLKRKHFVWRMDKLSAHKSELKNKFKDNLIDIDLVLNINCDELDIYVNPLNDSIKYISCDASIIDWKGKKENCGNHQYFISDLQNGVFFSTLLLSKMLKNKIRYLTNDILTLEFVFSTVQYLEYENNYTVLENVSSVKKEESRNITALTNDLESMYKDSIFSDTELRTSTQTFKAHKAILSARSPVFRSMFSNDMKEKNMGHIDITDFEDDTIHRMLLYMYTDSLEYLQFQSASELYKIADKYLILVLKSKCSCFLIENLCPTNACNVLVLADLHNDDGLKIAVQDYILGQRKIIFCSQEWKDFMKSHIHLAADVMYKKIYEE